MRRLAGGTKETLACLCMSLMLWTAATWADDPNDTAPGDEPIQSSSDRAEPRFITYARNRIKHAPPEEKAHLETVLEQWDNGVVDPKPILITASLWRPSVDEFTGQATWGGRTLRTSGLLSLSIVDEDHDVLGIRVKERYVLPGGVESSCEESYPVFIHRRRTGGLTSSAYIPIHFRTGNRAKDEAQWQAFLDRVEQGEVDREAETPPVWIARPDPNGVEVFVSVYDKQGHESELVPVSPPRRFKRRSPLSYEDEQALKSYKEKGAEFARWPEGIGRPRPNNAALLYLRAAAYQEIPDPCTDRLISLMYHGRKPGDRIRAHLGHNLKAIELVQLASQLPDCDFGLTYDSRGDTGDVFASLRRLSFVMAAYARTLADEGHYRIALENCLALRRFGRQIGDETLMHYLIGTSVSGTGIFPTREILQEMPSDVETLRWLRQQLAITEGPVWEPAAMARKWRDLELLDWQLYQGDHPFERTWALEQIEKDVRRYEKIAPVALRISIGDEAERKRIAQLPDRQLYIWMLQRQRTHRSCQYGLVVPEELLAEACRAYDAFVDSAVEVMDSDLSYEEKQERLEELEDERYEGLERSEPIALLSSAFPTFSAFYKGRVSGLVNLNLIKVALEVRLIVAETGHLPERLPEGLPKDLFNGGRDFDYEPAEDGFYLRMDPRHFNGRKTREFFFKTRLP